MFKPLLLIGFFLLQMNTVHSEVYKWTDEDGKIVYGDKPASDNANKINIKNTHKQDQAYQERYKKQQKLLNVMQEERDEKIAKQNEEQEKKEKQEQQCADFRKELQESKDAKVVYEKTDDPNNPRFYTDEERKVEEEKYEKYIKKNC